MTKSVSIPDILRQLAKANSLSGQAESIQKIIPRPET